MLPKLQQSSLANSLRRDNLASQIQCKLSPLFQARISLKIYYSNRTINHSSPGKINMHPRTPILPLETSLKSTCRKIRSKRPGMNKSTKLPCLVLWPNTPNRMESEAEPPVLSRKRFNSKSLPQNLELLKKDKWPHQNSVDTMTAETYQLESTIKTPYPNWHGKWQSSP